MFENQNPQKGEVVLYQPNETIRIEVRMENETVWLTQAQMAELFGRERSVISKHIRNVYKDGELEESITCAKFAHMGKDVDQQYEVRLYNLDVIISVGYRVKSLEGTHFRQWATSVLKEYIRKSMTTSTEIRQLREDLNAKLLSHDIMLQEHQKQIDFFVRTSLPPVEGVFSDGQIFDAYTFACDLIRSARSRLVLIDNYVDDTVLEMFAKRQGGVDATIYTAKITSTLRLFAFSLLADFEAGEILSKITI